MPFVDRRLALAAGLALSVMPGLAAAPAQAQGNLTLYCSPQEEWCRLVVQSFEKATGIKVAMTRKSSGETYAQIKAEASNPRGDVWWGGTGAPHLQAAEEGLTVEYKSPMLAQLQGLGGAAGGSSRSIAPSAFMPAHSATASTPSWWPSARSPSRSAGPIC